MIRALAILLALAACAPEAPPSRISFRDPAAILASKADLDLARLSGRWHEVARFPDGGCAGGTVDYAPRPDGGLVRRETCGGRIATGRIAATGPGRLRIAQNGATVEEWVLWLDADARTMVVARPDGTAARVLDRTPRGWPDRMRAAETVLDFNGFDTARLVRPGA